MNVKKLMLACAALVALSSAANAQQTVFPQGSGWIVNDPRLPPILISPSGSGHYILITPTTPGQPTTTVHKFGSGFIVDTPGKPSYTIMPLGSGWIVNKQ